MNLFCNKVTKGNIHQFELFLNLLFQCMSICWYMQLSIIIFLFKKPLYIFKSIKNQTSNQTKWSHTNTYHLRAENNENMMEKTRKLKIKMGYPVDNLNRIISNVDKNFQNYCTLKTNFIHQKKKLIEKSIFKSKSIPHNVFNIL